MADAAASKLHLAATLILLVASGEGWGSQRATLATLAMIHLELPLRVPLPVLFGWTILLGCTFRTFEIRAWEIVVPQPVASGRTLWH